MSTLFNDSGAHFSDCRRYRYALWRKWDDSLPMVAFIGLNPSTANETSNDPTIRRVMGFASAWNYGGVMMLNLFAYVTPYPHELKQCADPVGENDRYLMEYAARCERIVFAWGAFKETAGRDEVVKQMFPHALALHINKDGSPKHPLYVSTTTIPQPFNPAAV